MAELATVEIQRVSNQHGKVDSDAVIFEAKVLLMLNGKSYKSFYCLPTYLEEMVRGYLISEGVCSLCDIKGIKARPHGERFVVEAVINSRNIKLDEIKSAIKISIADIWAAAEKLNESSILFRETGGTHVAGILNRRDSVFAEDISRHCAIDKSLGLAFQKDMSIARSVLIVSCRQTASTISKAIYSRIPIVVSTSAVTGLAIKSARQYGITLIGFAREHRFNIYSHKERVIGSG
ncbi:MAG: formate dehydrogenase accessory sulfurtransferase FdhD [Dehalococcoidia bacterium]|nr:formate dehydrogenase accessory sulfurtransferase FdhD [Dehalococcoidia bacterium]